MFGNCAASIVAAQRTVLFGEICMCTLHSLKLISAPWWVDQRSKSNNLTCFSSGSKANVCDPARNDTMQCIINQDYIHFVCLYHCVVHEFSIVW